MSPDRIVDGLATTANDWRMTAFAWHVVLAAWLAALLLEWRPSVRLLGRVLVLPIGSVSLVAWASANPFNGATFGILAVLLTVIARQLPESPIRYGRPMVVILGSLLVGFGWIYPHFLQTDSWASNLYQAPFGVLPCPTLSVVIGITLVCGLAASVSWSATLIAVSLAYAGFGAFRLGVVLDYGLLFGAIALAIVVGREARSVRADHDERARSLPGDEFIPKPIGTFTHAVTITRAPQDVWPWLVQMGAGSRAGWYSYDLLDNGGRHSATTVIPALQQIAVGDVFPAGPGVTDAFVVLAFQPERFLVLGWPSPEHIPMVTWTFFLERDGIDSTRLIVRARGNSGYRFCGLPPWLSKYVIQFVHYPMQRKQLLGIARRAEVQRPATELVTAFVR